MKNTILLLLLLELYLGLLISNFCVHATMFSSPLEPVSSPKRSSYGEACSKLAQCDRSAWLNCHNGTCQCSQPDEMVYNEQTGKCEKQIGERCRVAVQLSKDDEKYIFEVIPCISNANCTSEGICACNKNFYQNSNGTCSTPLGYLEPCIAGDEIQCSTYQGLHCQAGKCTCKERKSVFYHVNKSTHQDKKNNSMEPQCVGLPGQPCINSKCVHNAECLKDVCTCKLGFYPDLNGICVSQFEPMSQCTKNTQCLHKGGQPFACLGGVCDCSLPDSMYATSEIITDRDTWNGAQERAGSRSPRCVGLVSSKCIDRRCAPNAYCSNTSKLVENSFDAETNHAGECKCRLGFWKTKHRTCGSSYQSQCERSRDCRDGLVCKNLRCYCPYEDVQSYDSSLQSCVSRIGGPCGKSVNATCARDAECRGVEPETVSQGKVEVGHCACKSGYVEKEDGSYNNNCIKAFGTPCRDDTECDQVAELACIDGKCGCKTFSEYNGDLRKCVGLVGGKCSVNELYQCANNSHCRDPRNKRISSGSCRCNAGFQETRNFTCKALPQKQLGTLHK